MGRSRGESKDDGKGNVEPQNGSNGMAVEPVCDLREVLKARRQGSRDAGPPEEQEGGVGMRGGGELRCELPLQKTDKPLAEPSPRELQTGCVEPSGKIDAGEDGMNAWQKLMFLAYKRKWKLRYVHEQIDDWSASTNFRSRVVLIKAEGVEHALEWSEATEAGEAQAKLAAAEVGLAYLAGCSPMEVTHREELDTQHEREGAGEGFLPRAEGLKPQGSGDAHASAGKRDAGADKHFQTLLSIKSEDQGTAVSCGGSQSGRMDIEAAGQTLIRPSVSSMTCVCSVSAR